MKNFTYFQPTSVALALPLLGDSWGPTELLAGGTDLHDRQKEYVSSPDKVVSLTGITGDGFQQISVAGDKVVIGAGVKLSQIANVLAKNPITATACAGLITAASIIGGPQIRHMGTLGGNLCQRNRCWYYRDEHVPCFLKGGSKCYALEGENEYHAIFTKDHPCVMVNPSTLAPNLIALGATASVAGPRGKREIDLAKFFQAPTNGTEREHVLAPNEIVTSVTIPLTASRSASYEVRHKQSHDWPLVHAAVAFKVTNGKATGVKVALGHVAPTPLVSEGAAKALEGKAIDEAAATAAGAAAIEGAMPLSMNGYKVQLLSVAVKRAALLAAGVKPYWND